MGGTSGFGSGFIEVLRRRRPLKGEFDGFRKKPINTQLCLTRDGGRTEVHQMPLGIFQDQGIVLFGRLESEPCQQRLMPFLGDFLKQVQQIVLIRDQCLGPLTVGQKKCSDSD